jgi:hypothetical protein
LIGDKPRITVHPEEPSEYLGPPLVEPRYAFEFRSSPRKADKSLPRLKRTQESLKCTALDIIDYFSDIAFLRQERFCFKTAYFVKRNLHKTGHILGHIWEELVKVGHGFKLLKDDFKFYVRNKKSKFDYKYDKPSYKDDIKLR